ncbi:unnamed protein product [Didymodactylos carnosus]|uniref:Uncharacterized protein n=1 Tax=Didymodactylos carnosus TaxID=1234261 RepID=A0A8S2D2J0_9BILA|nr:unnamed protein product [Didymodactylos carnosus]CAF3648901.1 unnamed protein product [Didymodactylos carnosus]
MTHIYITIQLNSGRGHFLNKFLTEQDEDPRFPNNDKESILIYASIQTNEHKFHAFNPPITRGGEQASALNGQQLVAIELTADYCYCLPTSRTVITSADVLIEMNRAAVPLKIELALFETI